MTNPRPQSARRANTPAAIKSTHVSDVQTQLIDRRSRSSHRWISLCILYYDNNEDSSSAVTITMHCDAVHMWMKRKCGWANKTPPNCVCPAAKLRCDQPQFIYWIIGWTKLIVGTLTKTFRFVHLKCGRQHTLAWSINIGVSEAMMMMCLSSGRGRRLNSMDNIHKQH